MYAKLRIVFCILAVAGAAAAVPVGIFYDWLVCLYIIAGAGLCGALMLACKNLSEKSDSAPDAPDFMNTPEENARILKEREEAQSEQETKTE